MKMKCIAVDDEPLALKLLADNISKLPYLELVASCGSAFEAMQVLKEQAIDLLFIDIQMPGLSGFDFIATLTVKPLVIFITAYKQYALDSYKLSVVDYLVKPVALDRFMLACNRARDLQELKLLQQKPMIREGRNYFFVSADYSQVKVVFDNIIWIEGLRDYIKFYLRDSNRPLLVRGNFKSIEQELPIDQFIRIHKSYMVNIACISSVRKNSLMINELELPIGETYRELVEKWMQQ